MRQNNNVKHAENSLMLKILILAEADKPKPIRSSIPGFQRCGQFQQ